MPIVSRRLSWLMLSFAFFLLLAPALFSPQIHAQEAGVDMTTILPAATQGGIGIIMLIVYLVQGKKDKQARDETMQLFTDQLRIQNETTKLAFEKYNERTEQMLEHLKLSHDQAIQIQKESQDRTELLTGTLARLEVKLAVPVLCPLREFSQLQKEG